MIPLNRQSEKNRKKKNCLLILLLSLSIFFLFLNIRAVNEKNRINREINFLEKNISDMEADRNESLGRISDASKEDFLEKTARQNNLKKEGEEVVAFIMEGQNRNASSTDNLQENKNLWQKFLGIFGIGK